MNHINLNTFDSDANRPTLVLPITSSSSLFNAISDASSLMEIDTASSQLFRPNTRSVTRHQQNLVDTKPNKPVPTYQKILIDEKPSNIINILENSRINSRMPKHIECFPDKTLVLISQRLNILDYPFLIKRLDQLSVTINFKNDSKEVNELLRILRRIEYRLIHFERDASGQITNPPREEFEVEKINIESAALFRQFGGIEIFKRILLMSLFVSETTTANSINSNRESQPNSNSISKRNSSTTSNETSKKTKLASNSPVSVNETNTILATESYSILKIKCKCIYILNRLICLPHFGKLVVQDLLNLNQTKTSAQHANDPASSSINYDTILLQYLFSLLVHKDSRLLACQLIESILLHMPMLNLNRITNLRFILESIDDEGLSSICRIFAVTLSDLDMSEKKYWANAQKKQQQLQLIQQKNQQQNSSSSDSATSSNTPSSSSSSSNLKKQSQLPLSVRDQNQELLLNIPTLLYRLVNLVRGKNYAVRYNGKNSELEHWIRYIDEALSDTDEPDNDANDLEDTNDSLMIDLNEFQLSTLSDGLASNENSRTHSENQLYQPSLLAATKLNNFVHVLYTLSLLLIGKERKRVQKSLAKLRLASALNSLFDYLIWNCRCEYNNTSSSGDAQQPPQPQIRSHICPEVAVKIQFLRLVHSFCDHSEYKRVVLSKEELDEILKYNKEIHSCLQVSENVLKVETRLRCTKEKVGLLSKIVQVIKQEPFSASFRFWLTRAIESFLRGGTSYADQMFLISRGIVEDTLQNILVINFNRPKEVLQSCFDMLGELIKFNTNGFDILNKQLVETEKFNMLLRMINQSLVDSNMFLRSIFLSIEFFQNNQSVLNFKVASNRLLSYFDSFERRIGLICRMINTINIHNLSQENVSCLNTTLVLLMLANRRNLLPKHLHSIKLKSIEMILTGDINSFNATSTAGVYSTTRFMGASAATSNTTSSMPQTSTATSIDLITNLRDLLMFWQSHYLQKDKDCIGLEQNSRIEFPYWKHTVELLLDPNPKNVCSLSYYLRNDIDFLNITRKQSNLEEFRCD